jgi:hypothetical protein
VTDFFKADFRGHVGGVTEQHTCYSDKKENTVHSHSSLLRVRWHEICCNFGFLAFPIKVKSRTTDGLFLQNNNTLKHSVLNRIKWFTLFSCNSNISITVLPFILLSLQTTDNRQLFESKRNFFFSILNAWIWSFTNHFRKITVSLEEPIFFYARSSLLTFWPKYT